MFNEALNRAAFSRGAEQELYSILQYWTDNTVDDINGGFVGEIDAQENRITQAEKGLVLNSRILWSFSAAALAYPNDEWEKMAGRAFRYIADHFMDRTYGGAYWSLDAGGFKKNGKKQTYGIAFCIYGLSEYVKLSADKEALDIAKELFLVLEENARDPLYGGYVEALTEDWKKLGDVRLSGKDDNAPKTTNTHLHVVEAYANLYEVWPDEKLAAAVRHILLLFSGHIIDKETGHLRLFFSNDWRPAGNKVSFGHDIEASWLLLHCARVLDDEKIKDKFKKLAIAVARATLPWMDNEGALWYEKDISNGDINKEKHWWVQAEAMVGFYNAYQLTDDKRYLQLVKGLWQFIQDHLVDQNMGEWYWGMREDNQRMNEPKAGFWKCPYHNTRACLELITRIKNNRI